MSTQRSRANQYRELSKAVYSLPFHSLVILHNMWYDDRGGIGPHIYEDRCSHKYFVTPENPRHYFIDLSDDICPINRDHIIGWLTDIAQDDGLNRATDILNSLPMAGKADNVQAGISSMTNREIIRYEYDGGENGYTSELSTELAERLDQAISVIGELVGELESITDNEYIRLPNGLYRSIADVKKLYK